jgi:hypothetical protein
MISSLLDCDEVRLLTREAARLQAAPTEIGKRWAARLQAAPTEQAL